MRRALLRFLLFLFLLVSVASAYPGAASDIIARFGALAQSLQDYQCRLSAWSLKNGYTQRRIANLYFKAPRYIRTDLIDADNPGVVGAVAVYLPSGVVVAGLQMGRFVVPIVLSPHSRAVTTNRGESMDETDLLGIYAALKAYEGHASFSVENDKNDYVVNVIPDRASMVDGVTRQEVAFDRSTMLPAYANAYESGTLVQHVVFSDFILNVGLPQELFDVRYAASGLAALGLRTVASMPVTKENLLESGLRQ